MADNAQDDKSPDYIHTSVSSGFNEHTPAYWRLALPALGARYGFRFVERLFKLGDNSKFLGLGKNQFFDAAAGAWMLGVTAFFARSTARDVKNAFAESVAYETGKNANDIGWRDMMKSDNNAVAQVRSNLIRYNSVRALVNASFFASFLPNSKHFDFKSSESVDLGLGLNGLYLTGEVVFRKSTFFEQLQNFIDRKINQRKSLGEDIKPIELMRLFERNALDNDPENAFKGKVSGEDWYRSQPIFNRMAELMNATYQHTPGGNKASFTLPKFLYLLGHNLIQPKQVEQTLAYINVANRYGMDALKRVVKDVRGGTGLDDALRPYPDALNGKGAHAAEVAAVNAAPAKKFAQDIKAASSHVERSAGDGGNGPLAIY